MLYNMSYTLHCFVKKEVHNIKCMLYIISQPSRCSTITESLSNVTSWPLTQCQCIKKMSDLQWSLSSCCAKGVALCMLLHIHPFCLDKQEWPECDSALHTWGISKLFKWAGGGKWGAGKWRRDEKATLRYPVQRRWSQGLSLYQLLYTVLTSSERIETS